jgi:hypothetical protein
MTTMHLFTMLSDGDLIARVQELAGRERRATAELVASLAEFDARRLYLSAGCSSLFTYCTQVLRLSESAAYKRIEAARAARRFPEILERLADGRLTLSSLVVLARVFSDENRGELLDAAMYKSKREVEALVARVRPLPASPATVRRLPTAPADLPMASGPSALIAQKPSPVASPLLGPAAARPTSVTRPLPPRRATVQPLAPEIFKVQFTLSREGHDKLRRAQDLLRHVIPNGDVALVFERALALLVEDLEKKRLAVTSKPRQARAAARRSRHIPAAVKRDVWKRDGGQCAFVGSLGRCTERGFLEFHHVIPYADGGETTAGNLQLRCAAHNAYEAALWSGADVARERASAAWG